MDINQSGVSPDINEVSQPISGPPAPVNPVVYIIEEKKQWYQKVSKKTWIYGAIGCFIMLLTGVGLMIFGGDPETPETITLSSAPLKVNTQTTTLSSEVEISQGNNEENSGSLTASISGGSSLGKKGIHKAFKLKTYTEGIDGAYIYTSYGSAIYIGDKKILTNAHVILGSDGKPTGKYNLCLTEIDADLPICVTPLKLIKYDKNEDIALLEVLEDVSLGEPVTLAEIKPELGDSIKVYGYPSNGGETLSLTEGKMSGSEKGYYKIDANIDHGNSGGGAFDNDGYFIGMPFSAQVGLSSMGYVIPVKTINDFLEDIGDIVDYKKDETEFQSYMRNTNKMILQGKISNEFFHFDGYKDKGFHLREIKINKDGYGFYTLASESEKTVIAISIPYVIGTSYFPFSGATKDLEKIYMNVSQKFDVEENGKTLDELIEAEGLKGQNGTVEENSSLYGYTYKGIEYKIVTDAKKGESEKVEAAKELFWDHLEIKKTNSLIQKDILELYSGSLGLPDGTHASMQCSTRCNYNVRLSGLNELKIATFVNNLDDIKGLNLTHILDQTEKMLSQSTPNTTTFKIFKNSKNQEYIFTKIINQKGEIELTAIFFGKENSDTYTEYDFSMTMKEDNVRIMKKFFEIVDSVELSLATPFGSSSTKPDSETYESLFEGRVDQNEDDSIQSPENSTIPDTVSGEISTNFCSTEVQGVTYTLNPCNIERSMKLSEGNSAFEYEIQPSNSTQGYSIKVRNPNDTLPPDSILGPMSGGAEGIKFQNHYFNARALQVGKYSGHLLVQITDAVSSKSGELRLKINLEVTE